MPTDTELLQCFVKNQDQSAFEEIVRRHLGLVYGSAFRRLGQHAHLSEDVCQKVFVVLARRAPRLIDHPSLGAWLHRCTRYASSEILRSEHRAEKITQSFATMNDPSSEPEPSIEWEKLRPVLDEAIDRLSERDRQIVILRYFNGRSFAEIGQCLDLKENAARMRASRALDRLRAKLASRGIVSTSASLGLILTTPALAAAPTGLVAKVTATALANASGGFVSAVATFFMTSKVAGPLLSATVAATLTAVVWHAMPPTNEAEKLGAFRTENQRINRLIRVDGLPRRVQVIAQAMSDRKASRMNQVGQPASGRDQRPRALANGPSARGHHFHGQDTPLHAAMSFAYASDATDVELVSKLIWFGPKLRERAASILATMPRSIQDTYSTPESFYALAIAADALIYPPPGPELFDDTEIIELGSDRVALRKKGSGQNQQEYQNTPDGWKFVMPAVGVERWPDNLNNKLLVKLGQSHGK